VAALKAETKADPLDDLAEQLAGDWQPVADLVAPVQQLLASCKSLEEFRERLPGVIPQLDAGQLAELIAKGLFAGTLAGRTGALE
jgi:phage gp29-like protein